MKAIKVGQYFWRVPKDSRHNPTDYEDIPIMKPLMLAEAKRRAEEATRLALKSGCAPSLMYIMTEHGPEHVL